MDSSIRIPLVSLVPSVVADTVPWHLIFPWMSHSYLTGCSLLLRKALNHDWSEALAKLENSFSDHECGYACMC